MKIRSHRELETYRLAFSAAVEIYNLSKTFPKEEIYFYPVKYDFYMGFLS